MPIASTIRVYMHMAVIVKEQETMKGEITQLKSKQVEFEVGRIDQGEKLYGQSN